MRRLWKALLTAIAASAIALGMNSPAFAATAWEYNFVDDKIGVNIIRDGTLIGEGWYDANRGTGTEEYFTACDWHADGKGIELLIDTNHNGVANHKVSTAGISSPTCQSKYIDIPEGILVGVKLCIVDYPYTNCGDDIYRYKTS